MKPSFCLLVLFCLFTVQGMAQTSARAAATARRKVIEEELHRLNTTIDGLREAYVALQKRLNAVEKEMDRLRAESAKTKRGFVTREEFNELVERIQEIERKRQADNQRILNALEDIQKLSATPVLRASMPQPPGNDYTVEAGNTLTDIINAYNDAYKEQGKGTISLSDVKRANPDLNPDLIRPGQTIRIPEP